MRESVPCGLDINAFYLLAEYLALQSAREPRTRGSGPDII